MAPQTELEDRLSNLTDVEFLSDFLEHAELDYDAGRKALSRAIDLIDHYYVHLPLKRAMYGIDPVRRLRSIANQHRDPDANDPPVDPDVAVRQLVRDLQAAFASLRDMHTGLVLPKPYRHSVAFLPFLVEACVDDAGHPIFIVSKVLDATDGFEPGVELIDWNWVPIGRLIDRIAELNGGANPDARRARAVDILTYRWLGISPPPDEERVHVRFRDPEVEDGKIGSAEFRWRVGVPPPRTPSGSSPSRAAVLHAALDEYREQGRRLRRALYAPPSGAKPWLELHDSKFDDVMRWAILPDPDGSDETFGYLRIYSFGVNDVAGFVDEVESILVDHKMQETSALIVDVRGNPGGTIDAGERILQLLSPRTIQPEPLQCLSTGHVLRLTEADASPLGHWEDLVDEGLMTGAPLSRGRPISSFEDCNDRGQRYQNPVVLIVDPLSYSTSDIMAAGFDDHEIGTIIGTAERTGAGGANAWGADIVDATLEGRDLVPDSEQPDGAWTLQFAIRCCRRVGDHEGQLLEDFGVKADAVRELTREDVLSNNQHLLGEAIALVRMNRETGMGRPRGRMRLHREASGAIVVETENVERVEVQFDQVPYQYVPVSNDQARIEVPADHERSEARCFGYRGKDLVVSARLAAPAHNGAGGT